MDEQSEQQRSVARSRRTRRRRVTVAVAAGVLAVATLGGVTLARAAEPSGPAGAHIASATVPSAAPTGAPVPSASALVPGFARRGATRNGSGTTTATRTTRPATAAEQTGVVDVTTVLDYGIGRAAGTGIVLTAAGEILTNNHVVDQATAITVTVTATGARFTAAVVGTDPTDDVAVLQLSGASGLATAPVATSAQVAGLAVGDAVTAVGNAGGTGGTPTAATGSVIALGQNITASDDNGTNPERLRGLIEVDAAIRAGDSGGPLESGGAVVGIDTAAGSRQGAGTRSRATAGFAIPVTTATAIADRIVAGERSSTIHVGATAFLGVQVAGSDTGPAIAGVVAGSPAARAGLAAGDTITAIDGAAVADTSALSTALGAHRPGDRVGVMWTDAAGGAHRATVTLTTGPAD